MPDWTDLKYEADEIGMRLRVLAERCHVRANIYLKTNAHRLSDCQGDRCDDCLSSRTLDISAWELDSAGESKSIVGSLRWLRPSKKRRSSSHTSNRCDNVHLHHLAPEVLHWNVTCPPTPSSGSTEHCRPSAAAAPRMTPHG